MAIKLTNGERVTVGRRRDQLTQGAFAKQHGVKQVQVSRWESGRLPVPPEVLQPYKKLGRLEQHELVMLYRKRSGLLIREAAKKLGVSRYQWIKIEAGDAHDPAALKLMQEYNKTWQGN